MVPVEEAAGGEEKDGRTGGNRTRCREICVATGGVSWWKRSRMNKEGILKR